MLKRMMKILPALALVLLFAQTASAQRRGMGNGSRRGPAHPDSARIVQRVDRLADTLTLTDKQQSDIIQLWLDHVAAVKAAINENQGDREAVRQVLEELRGLLDEGIHVLLTEEQQTQFEALKQERQDNGHGPGRRLRRGRRQGGGDG